MSVFAERFRILGALGAGGMGAVYDAEDLTTGHRVALKLAHGEHLTDQRAMRRFAREARILRELDHPNVVRVVADGEHLGRPYLAMELVPGETLSDRIRRGPLTPTELAPILRAVAFGAHAVHSAGIVHRDLKPSNILLPSDGGEAKIADFGIAKDFDASRLTLSGAAVGTPRYLAPEILKGADPSPRTDVYSLGIVAYEALSGRSPLPPGKDAFAAIAAGMFVPLNRVVTLPVEIEAAVVRATARAAKGRFASIVGFAEAFDTAIAAAADRGAAAPVTMPPSSPRDEPAAEPLTGSLTVAEPPVLFDDDATPTEWD